MAYQRLPYAAAKAFCADVFCSYGFDREQSRRITDVLLEADLSGIESHGIQRMVRYDFEIESGYVDTKAEPETVYETPISAVIDAKMAMGQLAAYDAMRLAIEKAQRNGVGFVTVRNSNHYGIAGYYANMAAKQDLVGICMTNTEAIMVPTFAREAMLGTNPIAFAMPAEPVNYLFDAATTVVPRGKLEVYAKRGDETPVGWAVDEKGNDCTDPSYVLKNIIGKLGGGILPLGGSGEKNSGYKGYGFGMLCEICTAIFSLGATSDRVNRTPGKVETCHFFGACDYGMFGDKAAIKRHFSEYLHRVREAEKAEGQARVYIHGEKEFEAHAERMEKGILLNEKTLEEMRRIALKQNVPADALDTVF